MANEYFDAEEAERSIASAASQIDVAGLQRTLARASPRLSLEEKARTYLQGPKNHTETTVPNEKTRNVIQNSAQVICLNAPPGVDSSRIRNRLFLTLDLHVFSTDNAFNEELRDPESPYIGYMQSSAIAGPRIPDKMKVEMIGNYLEQRVLNGDTRFLLTKFPETERQAAIFEEDVCLIHAYIFVDGPRQGATSAADHQGFIHANAPICEKLEAEGRFFKIDIRKPPRQVDADMDAVETTLRSIDYMATVMKAGDVFRSPPPPR
ncbi:MAG: hypothetical protein Q9170_005085 [Blastenia crenularia]